MGKLNWRGTEDKEDPCNGLPDGLSQPIKTLNICYTVDDVNHLQHYNLYYK